MITAKTYFLLLGLIGCIYAFGFIFASKYFEHRYKEYRKIFLIASSCPIWHFYFAFKYICIKTFNSIVGFKDYVKSKEFKKEFTFKD
ncbi:MAG: hypothetical protein MJZ34_07440 [Paludibacteraceae bacterium]|nr:hypothetical protein [Paludibacteraceae bacterium]